jgi:hypothetical protein
VGELKRVDSGKARSASFLRVQAEGTRWRAESSNNARKNGPENPTADIPIWAFLKKT